MGNIADKDLGGLTTSSEVKWPKDTKSLPLAQEAYRRGVIDATGGLAIPNLMNHQKSRNTAFKKYAIKFFNTKIKERRERLLSALGNGLVTNYPEYTTAPIKSASVTPHKDDSLDIIFTKFIFHLNNNPETSNYVGSEDSEAIKNAKAALQALIATAVKEAEDNIIKLCGDTCSTHGCELTPVRSVTGVMTSYCSMERVVLSAALQAKKEAE